MATIPFSSVLDWQPLPIDAQDIVTKVRLVVAGNRAGAETQGPIIAKQTGTWEPPSAFAEYLGYYPVPVVVEYEAPEHSVYGATRALALPAGVNPFLPPTDALIPDPLSAGFDNPGAPSVVRDGDPETYAEFTGGTSDAGTITYLTDPATPYVGFRLRYTLSTQVAAVQRGVYVAFHRTVRAQPPRDGTDWYTGYAFVNQLEDGVLTEIYAVVPESAQWQDVNAPFPLEAPEHWLQLRVPPTVDAVCAVTDFYPLVLNAPLLLDVAKAQVRLPAQSPQRVTIRGYVAPDREHTITGWPGGDYTGQVAQVQYDLGRTVIDFEQASSPLGLPAEAMEAARERRAATGTIVETTNYNLKMGIRG